MPNVTSVWDFSPGDTLTAAKLDDVNCGIHVFSGTATRDAAYGGSGERTLAEGEFAYLADTNTTQYYDGSAWVAVGASGFTYVAGATFSAVSSLSFATSTFTSTYRNYRVMLQITDNSVDQAAINMRLRASGTDTSTGYSYTNSGNPTNAATYDAFYRGTSATSSSFGQLRTVAFGDHAYSIDIFAPQVATQTNYCGTAFGCLGSGDPGGVFFGGLQTASTQFDSMTFYLSSGTFTGVYRVYGYSES